MTTLLEPQTLRPPCQTPTPAASSLRGAIMESLSTEGECWLESLLVGCPHFTWNQVFLEVDRMSRAGEIALTCHGCGAYRVSMPGRSPLTSTSDSGPIPR